MAKIFVRCDKCGEMAMHSGDWTGTMDIFIAGRTYHLCEECASPVLDYILESAEMESDQKEDE